jgi:hypothetical protein
VIITSHNWPDGEEHLRQRVADFLKAKEEHRFTVDVPAPREHALVEMVAQHFANDGEIDFVDLKAHAANDIPSATIEAKRHAETVKASLSLSRWQKLKQWMKTWF